jgi:hypothetical protein
MEEIGTRLPHLMFMVVASEDDHVQTALDHPHVLIQYQGLLNSGVALARLNPDRAYIESQLRDVPETCVDNPAGAVFDHMSIRNAVQPADIQGLHMRVAVAAGCCELADRVYYHVSAPQLDEVITGSASAIQGRFAPMDYSLSIHPNPFNPGTSIRFTLPFRDHVCLRVFDLRGRETAVLVDEQRNAGAHTLFWDAAADGVSSGVYLIRLTASGIVKTRKALYVK